MASLALIGTFALATAAVCLTAGCSSVGYYAQSIGGHLALLRAARPVPELIVDAEAEAALKERLALSQRMRDFAVTELKLPDNASYRRFADLKRSAAVWNVVAAPELSLQLKTWCYPIMGCAGYRGYFDRDEAESYATALREDRLEVSVYGVPAYSTLGRLPGDWMADPLLNTFIHWPEGELARLIFHELSHQIAYANDDTEFNESFATAVERIGGARWLATRASPQARDEYAKFDGRRQDFRALTMAYRDKLDALYRSSASESDKRERKAALMAQLHADHETLKRERWGGFAGYDGWFARANNASFGVLAAYNALVPDFERLFRRSGADFERFYAEVRRLAALPKAERRAALASPGD
ncbi:aminopeptidase [uncultured Piscinibacter sp.]|uniref:aminopeptidase n=1 Tax=uncultured Piscinibacter sp. TaxID=1131835 RepID=UPI00262D7C7B|nr:aminopeptidase [uncultured Piscinibacter sp.]